MTTAASLSLSKAARFLIAQAPQSFARLPALVSLTRSLRTIRAPPISASGMEKTPRDSAAATAGFSASSAGRAGHTFPLSPSTLLKIQKGDITAWSVDGSTDAIVNAANSRMLGGGGVDGGKSSDFGCMIYLYLFHFVFSEYFVFLTAIHRAAGPELLEACRKVPEVQPGVRCPIGEARITPAFGLPVSHVIHTVGPIYDTDKQPDVSLSNAYRNSLKLAKDNCIHYIAFPAISCGVYGYPYKEASTIAISVAKEFPDTFKEVDMFKYFLIYSLIHFYPIYFVLSLADSKTISQAAGFAPLRVAVGDRSLGSGVRQARGLTVAALPELPYDYGALEPAISGEIMKLHHQKHHQTYVTNYNNALEQLDAAVAKGDAAAVVRLQSAIKFNGGGHINHSIFWQNLKPVNEGGGEPPHTALGWAIDTDFGSLDAVVQKMNAEGAALQGSGWVWLALDKSCKKLIVETTANQDPLVTKGASLVPLLGIDVWEHAYYLQYKNVRPDYLKNIWKVINWKYASEVYEKETA
ncbi:Mn-superoxide dismutase I [Canna indica]|uniref:superoxide dismutase n=1 Tax=Canna indica TaxID=4628 RepID=A0AAQ3JS29_9LILI|nr:Mn-superoxide dismutase I [Canna indica]